ncbi:MAG TPA: CPBP family intramembrane glutamic endopeptidase [Blastocatellia bacterium]|nr:CPBP family intramembrane glutamic endopeptidase [Blastocatellia bacterium]
MQATGSNARRVQILIGLMLSLGGANLPIGTWGEKLGIFGRLLSHEVLWWVLVVILLIYVLIVERQPLSSIGFRRFRIWEIAIAIVAGIVMVIGIVVIYGVVFPKLHLQMNTGVMNTLLATPFWYRFMLVTRAAVAEETLFRGYAIERIEELTSSRALAALVSWALFTIAHLSSWGFAQLIVAGFGGVVLTILYLWRRNLWINMIAHWIADAAGFLLPH